MKYLRTALIPFALTALFMAACGSDGDVEVEQASPDERVETLWVGPQLVECVGSSPQMCMQVKFAEDGQAEYFYDSIDGFEHVAGTSYVIKVGVTDVADPPADGSSLAYRLIEVVEASAEAATAGLDGTSWQLLGYRDGDLFDAVPEGVLITAMFDGDRIGGSSGCNTYGGMVSADGDAITVSQVMGTLMACEAEKMEQEQQFLAILETVESAEITLDERLLLKPATGLMLVFVAA